MPVTRTRAFNVRLTPDEYETLAVLAGEQTLSAWARPVLLRAASASNNAENVILGELLALRAILLNLHFAVCRGEPVTAETMHRLIARADEDKHNAAQSRLATTAAVPQ
jgi:hypothetical protein